jgi:hypothetical protein
MKILVHEDAEAVGLAAASRLRDTRSIATALRGADAAIIVLGMASHALAGLVRAHAQASGIPCRTIDRATRRQLTESLSGLFSEGLPLGP